MLFLSYFATSCIYYLKGEFKAEQIEIPSTMLQQVFGRIPNTRKCAYLPLVAILIEEGIIVKVKNYSQGLHSTIYSLVDKYLGKGIATYQMTTEKGREKSERGYWRKAEKAAHSPIACHLLASYPFIGLPGDLLGSRRA